MQDEHCIVLYGYLVSGCSSFTDRSNGKKLYSFPLFWFCFIGYFKIAANDEQGFVSGVALEFLPPVTAARLLIKINIKNQCLTMSVKPKLKLGYTELFIAVISSRTCTKPASLYHLQGLRLCKKAAALLSKVAPLSAAKAVKN